MNEVNKIAIPQYSLQRILRKLLLTLSVSPIFTGNFRCKILKWAGVNILVPMLLLILYIQN